MAWGKKPGQWKKGTEPDVDFLDLLPLLLRTKTQQNDQPLYQLLKDLISKTNQNKDQTNSVLNSFFGRIRITDDVDLSAILEIISNINSILQFATFWTENDESVQLPASRRAVAGTNMSFDYSVPNEVTLNATGGGSGSGMCFVPLSQGIEPLTFVSDGLGQPMLIPFLET